MKKRKLTLALLAALFGVLMSWPYLVPHAGAVALFGWVPLLCMERLATRTGLRRLWPWHYGAFVLWNALTTFWVCNATVGGGIFAILANALQMSLIFGLFRWVKQRLGGVLPYIFLAAAWMAWERWYLVSAQISWPWLLLGNAFARSIRLVQWYEFTGTLGGSLWVWLTNLGVFGLAVALSDGRWKHWNAKARFAAGIALLTVFAAPPILSAVLWQRRAPAPEETLPVLIAQPNIDPYRKFTALSQDEQNSLLLNLLEKELTDTTETLLVLAPETFTGDIVLQDIPASHTFRRFQSFLQAHPGITLLFGASTYDVSPEWEKPSLTARGRPGHWYEAHNSAIVTDRSGRCEVFHKSKLVIGTEMTPYPRLFVPLDDWLSRKMGVSGLMGREIGQEEISLLHAGETPLGCAVCYESVYGEYCTGYVRKGARGLTVITNDAWWGRTPGYVQHLSYASLRAIETRRDIARSANTGISAFIDRRGSIVAATPWWEEAVLRGRIALYDDETFFVRHGDQVGRLAVFVCLLLLAAALLASVRKRA